VVSARGASASPEALGAVLPFAPCVLRYPRDTIAGCQPFDFRNSAIQSTSGVLPLPPATMLPTTMTGIPGCSLFSKRTQYRNLLIETTKRNARLTGHSSQATAPRRCQCFTRRGLLVGLRGEGDLREARKARGLHDAHH